MITAAPVPNDVAQSLTGRNYLSWSAVSTYLRCPLRYRFRYLDNVPEEFLSANLVFGSAIHAAVEMYFREQLAGGPPPGLDALLATYHESWSQVDVGGVQFGRQEDLLSLQRLAERMLTAFVASDFARPSGTILGIEEELTAPLIPDCPDLLARLDLLVETEEALVVTDLKTSRSKWSEADVEAAAGQVIVYHELVQRLSDKPVRLQFAVLTKTKQPQLDLHPVTVDRGRTARIRQLIRRVWRAIAAGHFYPAPSAMQCPGCPFRHRCQAWSG